MIADFLCTYDQGTGIPPEIAEELKLPFPEAYQRAEMMAELALRVKEKEGTPYCLLPFCHTLEAEAMGGLVHLGDEKCGPRASAYCCHSVEELLALPEIAYDQGRIREVLRACQMLSEQGEQVVLMISGPFTIGNVLIDPSHLYKAVRKQPKVMRQVFAKIERELLRFVEEAIRHHVTVISYADSAGSVSILGPKLAAQTAEMFTYGFVKKAADQIRGRALLQLCPKTTLALKGTGKADFLDHKLPRVMSYGEACVEMSGKVRIAGQMCIQNTGYLLEDRIFREVRLL